VGLTAEEIEEVVHVAMTVGVSRIRVLADSSGAPAGDTPPAAGAAASAEAASPSQAAAAPDGSGGPAPFGAASLVEEAEAG
jgi:hypothetical protein